MPSSSEPADADGTRSHSWQSSAWLALGLLALLLTLRLTRSPSGVPTPAAPPDRPAEPGSLVVMPLQVLDASGPENAWLREGLAEMIRSQLGQMPGVQVVVRHRLVAALRAAGLAEDSAPPAAAAVQIARELRAATLVTGSFADAEGELVLDSVVVDVATGRSAALSLRRGKGTPLLEAVAQLCGALQPQLHLTGGAAARPGRLPTQSVEAYRAYVLALESFARGGQSGAEAAETQLRSAVRRDPGFALAFLKLAEVQSWRRAWGYGDPDPAPAVRAAAALARTLPERERLLVESYQARFVEHQPPLALARWDALLQFHPMYAQEIGVPGVVADTLYGEGRWDDLIALGEAHVDAPSLAAPEQARLCSLLAQAYRRKGQFARAQSYARRAVQQWPVRHGPRFLAQQILNARIGLEAGQHGAALAAFESAARDPEADATSLTDAGWGLYMAGAAAQAAAAVARALEHDSGYGNAHHLKGWLELAAGKPAAASRSLEAAFEHTPHSFGSAHQGQVRGDLAALYYAGVAAQRAGDQQRALALFTRLIALGRYAPPDAAAATTILGWQAANFCARASARLGRTTAEPPALHGDDSTFFVQSARLHSVAGRRAQALQELARGLALGFGEYRHLQDDPDFLSLHESAEFRRLVSDRLPR